MNKLIHSIEFRSEQFIFDALAIENYTETSTGRLRHYFKFIRDNVNAIDGDIYEFGVFRGKSLISVAILLKKLGSSKKVFGFDSFSGFPGYHENDSLDVFKFNQGMHFDPSLVEDANLLKKLRELACHELISKKNISSSSDFSKTSYDYIQQRIKDYELDNVVIVQGDFKDTVNQFFSSNKPTVFASNMDCDLYESYLISLKNVWPRMSVGGYIHLDEYYSLKFPGAKIACDEFFSLNGIKPIQCPRRPGEFERWCVIKE